MRIWVFFFFQAEDGIRDGRVTGVQTCALPISCEFAALAEAPRFEPQEMHKPTLPARTMFNRTSFRLIALLPAKDSDSPAARWRKRFGNPQDLVTAISLPLAPEPWKTPEAEPAESRR